MNKTNLRYIAAAGMVVAILWGCRVMVNNSIKEIKNTKYGWLDSSKTSFYVPIDSFSVIPYHYYCDTINWKAKYDSLLKRCNNIPFESRIIDVDTGKIILKLN